MKEEETYKITNNNTNNPRRMKGKEAKTRINKHNDNNRINNRT